MSLREHETFDIGKLLAEFGVAWLDDGDSEYCEQQRRVCMESMAALNVELLDIKRQLDEAKTKAISNGVYSDAGWFRRAQHAQRVKGFQYQRLQEILGEFNRRIRYLSSLRYERQFIEVARRKLSKEQFTEIADEAERTSED